ncbi:MAG: hypothetical protein KJO69_10155, partial [Gammaproteobacteria bacterium]|nr:hypothetical protein [Gammaproteobacteria bacterium]
MTNIEQLAAQLGFLPSYKNCFGDEVSNSPQALEALIKALGYTTDSSEDIERAVVAEQNSLWTEGLPACVVIEDNERHYGIEVAIEK